MSTQKKNMNDVKNPDMEDNAMLVSNAMVEEQIAHNIIKLLDNRAQYLTFAEEQRLAAARNLAVKKLAYLQMQAASHHGINWSGNVLQWFGHHRMASAAFFIGALLIALFVVQQFGFNNHLENSDAFLLASDLPPEAYADKGFDAWIGSN